jgi:hypothetical protein
MTIRQSRFSKNQYWTNVLWYVYYGSPPALTLEYLRFGFNLSWSASIGAVSYNIYSGSTSGGETQLITGVTGTTYTDGSPSEATTVYYYVTAVNADGQESEPSNEMAGIYYGLGSNSFIAPTGITSVSVQCFGGGGYGSVNGSFSGGAGGGGGAYAATPNVAVTPTDSYVVNIDPTISSFVGDFTTVSATAGLTANGTTPGLGGTAIGTFAYNGGNGATNVGTSGGGGGSSAGTASNGNNASGITGGAAPINGTRGGNGGTNTHIGENGSLIGSGGGGGGENAFEGGRATFGIVAVTW